MRVGALGAGYDVTSGLCGRLLKKGPLNRQSFGIGHVALVRDGEVYKWPHL